MSMENSSDGFKEADEVADGMIPDCQIVDMVNQIALVKDVRMPSNEVAAEQKLAEAAIPCETDNTQEMENGDELRGNRDE